mmetsp:Transcript_10388/g.32393  ORF Transcript_10388/g.32393 Transcript_10388/m.32393 type:complete len:252 (+) Transcript_10388:423-1178(+)
MMKRRAPRDLRSASLARGAYALCTPAPVTLWPRPQRSLRAHARTRVHLTWWTRWRGGVAPQTAAHSSRRRGCARSPPALSTRSRPRACLSLRCVGFTPWMEPPVAAMAPRSSRKMSCARRCWRGWLGCRRAGPQPMPTKLIRARACGARSMHLLTALVLSEMMPGQRAWLTCTLRACAPSSRPMRRMMTVGSPRQPGLHAQPLPQAGRWMTGQSGAANRSKCFALRANHWSMFVSIRATQRALQWQWREAG